MKTLPELFSAAILLWLWMEPMRFGTEWFRSGVLTLMLEFFVIHSSGFMSVLMYDPESPARKRALQVAGLGAGYLLFISAFAWGFNAWWMLWAFAWLCFSKIQAIWRGVPRLSVTDGICDAAGFDANGGAWEAEPHRALAGAVMYFAIMGLSRPLMARWQGR